MNPIGTAILMVVLVLVFNASRRRAMLGMMIGIIYLTQAQQIDLGGFNLFAFRLVELAGYIRVISRREFVFSQKSPLDKILLVFICYTVAIFILRWGDGIVYRIGWGIDTFLTYFCFRGLIRDADDLRWALRTLALLLLPYALFVLYESFTNHNLFSAIGGRIGSPSMMREGRLRAAGSFRHPSLMGTLGSSFLPVYIGLAFEKEHRKYAILGILCCLGIVLAANSGAPLSCAGVAIVGWMIWKIRSHMKLIRRASLVLFILLALIMKAPVWYLIARISDITGGDGYHRAKLMEQGFNSIMKWGLVGMPIEETRGWFPYFIHLTGGADITNQYLAYGITSGLGSMGLFLWLLIQIYRHLGRAQQAAREDTALHRSHEALLWGLGVMVFVHMFNWLGITYFDQFYAIWYLQFAAITSMIAYTTSARPSSSGHSEPVLQYKT